MHLIQFVIGVCMTSLWLLVGSSSGKVLKKCEIVHLLTKHKISRTYIAHWLCLINAESGADTAKIQYVGSQTKYGLFQLESTEWCGLGKPGGKCNIDCRALLTDSIEAQVVACAKKKFYLYGFKAWPGWVKNCRLKPLPNIQEC